MLAGKTLLDYINYINDYKNNNKKIYSILTKNMSSLEFRLKK